MTSPVVELDNLRVKLGRQESVRKIQYTMMGTSVRPKELKWTGPRSQA
jgi:hypothetical protein